MPRDENSRRKRPTCQGNVLPGGYPELAYMCQGLSRMHPDLPNTVALQADTDKLKKQMSASLKWDPYRCQGGRGQRGPLAWILSLL